MVLILLIVILTVLKWLQAPFIESISWWWITALFFLAMIWFEFFERLLGLDRRNHRDEFNQAQKDRAKEFWKEIWRPKKK